MSKTRREVYGRRSKEARMRISVKILDQLALQSAIYKEEEDTVPDENIFDNRHSMDVQPNQSGYWFSNLLHKRKVLGYGEFYQ